MTDYMFKKTLILFLSIQYIQFFNKENIDKLVVLILKEKSYLKLFKKILFYCSCCINEVDTNEVWMKFEWSLS